MQFSLRTLILTVTALAILCGYGRWRQLYVKAEVERLSELRVEFSDPVGFLGIPKSAIVYGLDNSELKTIAERVAALGVESVQVDVLYDGEQPRLAE